MAQTDILVVRKYNPPAGSSSPYFKTVNTIYYRSLAIDPFNKTTLKKKKEGIDTFYICIYVYLQIFMIWIHILYIFLLKGIVATNIRETLGID